MIELAYKIDLKKDDRNYEGLKVKDLTKAEAANLIHFLEKIKLNFLNREFELGEGGFDIKI